MFFNKRKKEEKTANEVVKDMITHKALKDLEEKNKEIEELNDAIVVALGNAEDLRKQNKKLKSDNKTLKANLEVLETTVENIKEICDNSKGKVISKNKILKELGE